MTHRYAEIIVGLNQPKVDRIFSYRIPEGLTEVLQQGMVVEVPFGSGNRKTRGFVVGLTEEAGTDPEKVKEIRKVLMEEPAFTERELTVARWMQSYYDAPLGACLSLWVPRQVTRKPRKKIKDPAETPDLSPKLRLNEEQVQAARPVDEMLDLHLHRTFLLHGITGSGKTELYLQWIEHTLDLGRQAIVLVPEISLTPQLIDIFTRRFGHRVGVTHSRLTDAERAKLWRDARGGEIDIMIGPRSALFTPFRIRASSSWMRSMRPPISPSRVPATMRRKWRRKWGSCGRSRWCWVQPRPGWRPSTKRSRASTLICL